MAQLAVGADPVPLVVLHPVWQLPRDVVLFLLLAELLVSAEGRGRPSARSAGPRSATVPCRTHPPRARLARRPPPARMSDDSRSSRSPRRRTARRGSPSTTRRADGVW